MKDTLAKLISSIFSPFVVIPAFGLWTITAFSSGTTWAIYSSLFIVLIVIAPLVYIVSKIRKGSITDIHVAIKEQRFGPFVISTVGAAVLAVIYHVLKAPSQLISLATVLVVSGIVFSLMSRYWKVSIHTAAFAGSVFIVSALISPWLFWLSILLPLISWARVIRKRHDLSQAAIAAIIVCLCVYLTLKVF